MTVNTKNTLYALLLFVVSIVVAGCLRWTAGDIVWSVWLSSLTVGSVTLVLGYVKEVAAAQKESLAGKAVGAWAKSANLAVIILFFLFLCFISLLIFVVLHGVQALFLNIFFPVLESDGFPGWSAFVDALLPKLKEYVLFIPLALWVCRKNVTAPEGSSTLAPYKSIVTMHIFIVLFTVLHIFQVSSFWIYVGVYSFFIVPWRQLRKVNV